MSTLALTSIETGAGKTAICAGLGAKLLAQGRKLGYFKPLRIISEETSAQAIDRDAQFMKQVLDLKEPAESLCPVTLTKGELDAALARGEKPFLNEIEAAYKTVAQGKDVVLVEGLSGLGVDDNLTQAFLEIADALDAKAIVVIRYSPAFPWPLLSGIKDKFGPRFLGVVINAVPRARMSWFEKEGIKTLGVIPEERLLLTVTVSELAGQLEGEVLNSPER